MALEGRLYRCPRCIAPLPRAMGAEGQEFILDPEGNVCPKCGHVFSAAAVLEENYPSSRKTPRDTARKPAGRPRLAATRAKQEALFKPVVSKVEP